MVAVGSKVLVEPMFEKFVGRKKELDRLNSYLHSALEGNMQACFIVGEAGSGKSSLIAEFAQQAQSKNDKLIFISANCNAQTGISDSYQPFRQILKLLIGDEAQLASNAINKKNANRLKKALKTSGRALIEIAPELIGSFIPFASILVALVRLGAKEKGLLEGLEKQSEERENKPYHIETSQIFQQYTALLRKISKEHPIVLVLDDLQWVDNASNALFFHLSRELVDTKILLIGLYRANDIAAGRNNERHPLEQTVNEIKRYRGNVWIDLDQATVNHGRAFIDAVLEGINNDLDESFRAPLFKHTHGHALFTVELLRKMQESGQLFENSQGKWQASSTINWSILPTKVEAIVEERVERLDEELKDILNVASVEGMDFTVEVIGKIQHLEMRLRNVSIEMRHQNG